jgi:hypothetical protein
MDATQLILLLVDTPGIGEKTIAAILRRNAITRREPNEMVAFSEEDLVREYGIRPSAAKQFKLRAESESERLRDTARLLSRSGISLVTCLDAAYPAHLAQRMVDPPPIMFSYGNSSLFQKPLLAIANSNVAGEDALAACDRAVEIAVELGWSLVTGHNRIEYQRPALAAKRNGAGICYVLDRGLIQGFGGDLSRDLFPAARIWGPAYDSDSDLSISPFGIYAHGNLAGNRKRDALIFALADAVFSGHIRSGGEMERQCAGALNRGCHVFRDIDQSEPSEFLESIGTRAISAKDFRSILGGLRIDPR